MITTNILSHTKLEVNGLDEYLVGYKKYQLLDSAISFGVFRYLHDRGMVSREIISKELGIRGMMIKDYLQTLVQMGWLVQDDKSYGNSELAEQVFFQGDPTDTENLFRCSSSLHPGWGNLKSSLQTDTDPTATASVTTREFVDFLTNRSLAGETQAIVEKISAWKSFTEARTMLEIGGGHASVGFTLCKLNPNLQVTFAEKPFVKEYAHQQNLDRRVTDLGTNIPIENIQGNFDIVFFSHYLYSHRKFLEFPFTQAFRSMKPNGLIVANHWFCETGCAPEQSGITALDKAFLCFGHPLCHVETFSRFFISEGFTMISEEDIPGLFGRSRLQMAKRNLVAPIPVTKEIKESCC